MNEAFVYKWTDKTTGMMYIGVHKGDTDDGYICSSKIMMPLYNERPHDFKREILASGTDEFCRQKEEEFLLEVDAARNPLFYNRHNGNKNFVMLGPVSEETKKKMSKGRMGMKFSPEHKQRISDSMKGKTPPNKGKPHRIETKLKISKSRLGQAISEETKLKMSLAKKRNKI